MTDGAFVPNNKFIEINKRSIIHLDIPDYDFFWGCMKLFDTYGINYFDKYMDIVTGRFGDFSDGLESWLASFGMSLNGMECFNNQILNYHCRLSELIEWLHFFDISYYQGISVLTLEALLKRTPELYREAYSTLSKQYKVRREIKKNSKIDSYYNFKDFSILDFSKYIEKFTKYKGRNIVTIDDALNIAKSIPKYPYVVLLLKDNQICFIGKTENLLQYIGSKNKKYMADSVIFEKVDKTYVDDVLLAIKMFFNYPLDGARITK